MKAAQLFDTVATDHLAFGHGTTQLKNVVDFMGMTNKEVARIASVAPASVRYDDAAPRSVVERLEEIANIANTVAVVFDGSAEKTALWFRTKNPLLGDVSPRDMLRLGRYERLRRYVVSALAERG